MYTETVAPASPYARVGAKLIDNGFSAIALVAGTKRPSDGGWTILRQPARGWQSQSLVPGAWRWRWHRLWV